MNRDAAKSDGATGAGLLAGAARCDISPPLGAPLLIGFDDVVQSIAHPLFARVLYLEDAASHEAAVIVAVDLAGLTRKAHDEVRRAVADSASVAMDRVVVNASHTHNSPYVIVEVEELIAAHGYHCVDLKWFREAVIRIAETAARARAHREPATISVGVGQMAELAFNRRLQYVKHADRPHFDKLRRYPLGVTDPALGILRLDRADGSPLAIVCNFASHATVYAPQGTVSSSYPGVAMQALEHEVGDRCVAVFLQGCGGNISPGRFWPSRSVGAVETAGRLLAGRVQHVLEHKMENLTAAPSEFRTVNVSLPLEPLGQAANLAELERQLLQSIEGFRKGEIPPELAQFPTVIQLGGLQSAVVMFGDRFVLARNAERYSQYDLFAWISGELCLVVLPGECFVEFALEIKDRSTYRHTFVAAYNDLTPQYIPDPVAFEEGGYEVGPWCYSTTETGPKLVNAAAELIGVVPLERRQR